MALTGAQKVTVAEITYETYEKINELAPNLNADQEAAVIADIALWNETKNKVHIRLEGSRDGENLIYDRLLSAITIRVRLALELPAQPSSLCPAGAVFAGGISRADMETRKNDPDRPRSAFTSNLHRDC